MSDLDAVRAAIELGATKVLWVETPSNPLMKITGHRGARRARHEAGAARRRRQHVRLAGAAAAARARRRRRRALDDEVPRRALRRRRRRARRRRRGASSPSRSTFTQFAAGAVSGPMDAFLTSAASRPSASGWTGTARTRSDRRGGSRSTPASSASLPGPRVAPRTRARRTPDVGLRRHDLGRARGRRAAARRFAESTTLFQLAESLGGVESLVNYPLGDDARLGEGHRGEVPESSCACRSASRTSTTCSPTSTRHSRGCSDSVE